MATSDDDLNDKKMPLLDHLIELRQRLIWSIAALLLCFLDRLLFLRHDLRLPGEAAAAGRVGRQPAPHDLHGADRGVLHLREGRLVHRAVRVVSGHRHADLDVRGARPLQAREAGLPAVPGGDAGAVPDRRRLPLLRDPAVRLEVLRQLRGAGRRGPDADRARSQDERVPVAGHGADPRLRHQLPAAGPADAAGEGRDRLVGGARRKIAATRSSAFSPSPPW